MVDSARGISNFHSPSDVIVDASMPAMIRAGGKMYGADGRTKDTKAVNPESTFSRIYQEDHQLLQDQRRVRPDDHGHRPERRPDGAAGRGVRLTRQDVRDSRGRRRQHRRPRHRRGAADAECGSRRHLAHARRQGRTDPRLGQAGRHPCTQLRHAGVVLAGPVPAARERAEQEGSDIPGGSRHRVASTSRSCRRCVPCGTHWSA